MLGLIFDLQNYIIFIHFAILLTLNNLNFFDIVRVHVIQVNDGMERIMQEYGLNCNMPEWTCFMQCHVF